MQRFSRVAGVVASIALVVAASGCAGRNHAGGSGIVTTNASVLQPASTGSTTVGYLDIRNNGSADELTSVSTSVGGKVQLRAPNGQDVTPIVMQTVTSVPLPSDTTTQFIPNSYHLLISGTKPMHDGKDIQLTLTFAHAAPITVYAIVTNPSSGGSTYFLN